MKVALAAAVLGCLAVAFSIDPTALFSLLIQPDLAAAAPPVLAMLPAIAGLRPGMAFAAVPALAELQGRKGDLVAEWEQIIADVGDGDLTKEQEDRIAEIKAEIARLDKRIENLPPAVSNGRKTTADPVAPPNGGPAPSRTFAQVKGEKFDRLGDFAQAVHAAVVRKDSGAEQRLQAAATTYGSEGNGGDGGYLVPQEFRRAIWQKVMAEENLLSRCDIVETGANSLTVPKDETTPWQTTGGVQVYWEAEGAQGTQSKPVFETNQVRLNKLFGLVPVTEELLSDAPGLESWLRSKAPQKMAAKINTAIIRGTGAGQPLGILNSGSLVTVSKETSQPADTVRYPNIVKMWSRMYAPCRRNAAWFINQDIEPQLLQLAFDPAATDKMPVYIGPNGAAGSPYATIMGRPVVPIEACSTLGDAGDIIFADLSQYMALTKAGQDIRTDVSMHLYFDQDMMAFRFIFRVNGQPYWGSTVTPENGTATRSWAVTIEDRS